MVAYHSSPISRTRRLHEYWWTDINRRRTHDQWHHRIIRTLIGSGELPRNWAGDLASESCSTVRIEATIDPSIRFYGLDIVEPVPGTSPTHYRLNTESETIKLLYQLDGEINQLLGELEAADA